jgi:hypothetical protein
MKQINIFGSSEKLLELEDVKILQLLKSSPSIGINRFGLKYPTEYILFSDTPMAEDVFNSKTKQKILTNYFCYKYYFKNHPEYNVAGYWEPNSIEGSIGNSSFFALWWCVQNKFTHVNLYGILDSDEYVTRANGKCIATNIYAPTQQTTFNDNQFNVLKNLIDTGFNGEILIKRPLLRH